jgi:hypothetical protein
MITGLGLGVGLTYFGGVVAQQDHQTAQKMLDPLQTKPKYADRDTLEKVSISLHL